jgi:hypothetical protein
MREISNQILERYVELAENELRATQQICNTETLEKTAIRLIDADIEQAKLFDKAATYEAIGRVFARSLCREKGNK